MWWIAACLGALLWLLVVRIKLKEKQRHTRRDELPAQTDALGRRSFINDGFVPVATQYLRQEPEAAALILLFARFAWDDKPAEVHMEVLPVRVSEGTWPAVANECAWVTRSAEGKLAFEPPQVHWERLAGLEPWLDKLASFAEGLPQLPGTTATLEDYRVHAWLRREGDEAVLDVVGEPK